MDRAMERVLNVTPAWFCEADPHAASVLRRWWPDVPVLPDVKTQDWTTVEPVEIVSAGYPCQPFSAAGQRKGTDDPRHLWPFVIAAVRVLRPRLVVLENVAGHLSLGFDRVLCDLAEAGFDAEWCVLPASAAGACHRRERLFVAAYADGAERRPHDERRGRAGQGQHTSRQAPGGPQIGREGASAHASSERLGEHPGEPPSEEARAHEDHQPRRDGSGPLASDSEGGRLLEHHSGQRGVPISDTSRAPHSDADDIGCEGAVAEPRRNDGRGDRGVVWGDYAPAIERWESVIGRAAPAPVDKQGRLNVPFVEWMQGFDSGWVDGLKRTPALRCLGNAVVQQQGELALRMLLEVA